MDLDAIGALLREAAATAVMPRFRSLAEDEVRTKGVDHTGVRDLVTVADLEAERLVTDGLADLAPGIPVVGEEAVAADPSLAEGLAGLPAYFVLDPVDGTAAFVAGRPTFGIMLALVHHREVAASWILLPVPDRMYVAELGAGAFVDGRRLEPRATGDDPATLRAWLSTRYLPEQWTARVAPGSRAFASVGDGPGSSASAYTGIVEGEAEVGLLWRTQPWDHVPGALLLRETGGASRRFDGTDYRPGDDATGLLLTADARAWDAVRSQLLG